MIRLNLHWIFILLSLFSHIFKIPFPPGVGRIEHNILEAPGICLPHQMLHKQLGPSAPLKHIGCPNLLTKEEEATVPGQRLIQAFIDSAGKQFRCGPALSNEWFVSTSSVNHYSFQPLRYEHSKYRRTATFINQPFKCEKCKRGKSTTLRINCVLSTTQILWLFIGLCKVGIIPILQARKLRLRG